MGRRAIPIELIDEVRKRHTTFNKRKLGLLKKAIELSILCDVEISVIMFSKHNGETKMHQYSSSEPQAMLERALTFSGPIENFTNASFPHASSSKTLSRGEKRPREDASSMIPITPMTHLLNTVQDQFADVKAPHTVQKVCRPRIEPVHQAYAESLERRMHHTIPQMDDPDSHSYSNIDSNNSPITVQGQQEGVVGSGTWESTGGNENIIPTSMPASSLPLGSSSMTLKHTVTLPPLPSPIRKLDRFGRNTKLWRRDLNVHIPHSNIRSAAEISAQIFKTPKGGHEHQTFPNSFENQHAIADLPLDPLATPKTPFGFPSPATMNASRLVTSEPVASPIAPNFPASVAI